MHSTHAHDHDDRAHARTPNLSTQLIITWDHGLQLCPRLVVHPVHQAGRVVAAKVARQLCCMVRTYRIRHSTLIIGRSWESTQAGRVVAAWVARQLRCMTGICRCRGNLLTFSS